MAIPTFGLWKIEALACISMVRVDDNESDVVLLGNRSGSPVAYLGKLIRQLGRRARLSVANDVFKLDVAEGTHGHSRFSYALGVEQEAAAWGNRHYTNGVVVARLFHSEE